MANYKSAVQPIVLLGCFTNCLYHTYHDKKQLTMICTFCLCMHCCCFIQGERKAFKTTPAENIYANLSEVRADGHACSLSFLLDEEQN